MIIGLDVGGTHTDVVLLDHDGLKKEIKVPTDMNSLFNSVLAGLDAITENIDSTRIHRMVLSTTLTTNAIVQKKIPPVGMIVSSGPGINPEYFRTNSQYFVVSGSIDHRGREVEPINPDEIHEIAAQFKHEGIRLVGVVGKFSVRNPSHELQISNLLKVSFEKIFMGHRISGNLNFPRRIATTFLNASVHPIHTEFFQAVQNSLEAKGLNLPIRLLKADGGNMEFESSVEYPAQTILSGPAASIMGAVAFGSETEDTLVMDIGGTTTDMGILINAVPVLNPQGIELASYKTHIRSLETLSIGLGGDSTVTIEDGQLKIGPERAGPAMAYGGPKPTPTDALAILNDIGEGDRERSIDGLKPLADCLNISVEAIAANIVNATCQEIIASAQDLIERINRKPVYTIHELQEGYRVNPKNILVLGGPAPYFAKHIKQISNYDVRVVPRWKVANAVGAALARTTCDVTLFADTEHHFAEAPEENLRCDVDHNYDMDAAIEQAFELLRVKAIKMGANPDFLSLEVVEALQFNMVRGFNTVGKNIRVNVQVKPGLIQGYDHLIARLANSC